MRNAMTVDVEDYFQVSAFESRIKRSDWPAQEFRAARNVDRILEIFSANGVTATFFTLGWIAKEHPEIVQRIVASGHEVASHGWAHHRVSSQDPKAFRDDIRRTKATLEDVAGTRVIGYRAASFSMGKETPWAHEILEEEGHEYSSSIYPVNHDHYGMPDAPTQPYAPNDTQFIEFPLSTVPVFGKNRPCAGGGYFRLVPYWLSKLAIERVNQAQKQPAIFYFHPWEIDADQPRVAGVSMKTRFRHYVNLARFEKRLMLLTADFEWGRMDELLKSQRPDSHQQPLLATQ